MARTGPSGGGLPVYSRFGMQAEMRESSDRNRHSSRAMRIEAWGLAIVQAIPLLVMAKVWFGN